MDFITNVDGFMKKQKEANFIKPLIVVLVAAILSSVSGYFMAPATIEIARYTLTKIGNVPPKLIEPIISSIYISSIVAPFIVTFAVWIILTGILYLLSMIFKGEGDFKTLLKLMAFSFIPNIVVSPANIYIAFYISKSFEKGIYYGLAVLKSYKMAGLILGLAVLLWQYIYWLYAVKNGRNLTQRDAAIVSAILFVGFVILQIYSFFSHGVSTL